MTFICRLYCTLLVPCIFVFVYIHQPTQPVVLILTICLYIPRVTWTVLSVLNKVLNINKAHTCTRTKYMRKSPTSIT